MTAFGWSSGEPEEYHWRKPGMVNYLQRCGQSPHLLGVSVHEYSFNPTDITDGAPFRVGRFQMLNQVCDSLGILRVPIHITEWGWALNDLPDPNTASPQLDWAAGLYTPHPNVRIPGLWYLGGGWGGIADKAQRLIQPITDKQKAAGCRS